VFKGQRKINIKVLFKNILKIAAFFPFENSLTHGGINQDLWYLILKFLRISLLEKRKKFNSLYN
jgi:hypothetical protein